MPDQALFQAAASGALDRPDGLRREIDRLMKDQRFRASMTAFHRQWLDLDKVPGLMRDGSVWSSGVPLAAADETERFLAHSLLEADGRVETILGARYSFINRYTARIYGLPSTDGLDPVKTDLPAGRRGLLTQGSLLALNAKAGETSPILRGLTIRTKLICQGLPQPPADIPDLKPPAPNLSTRERHLAHSTDPACRGCHQMIDEIGFAFEGFDQIGRARTTDGGKPVDTRGTLKAVDGMDRPFGGAEPLIEILAKSPEVRACVARQWMRYALARGETQADEASFEAAVGMARAANDDLRAFIVAFASSPTFTHRAAAQGE
jgi:hypothetical protein